MSILGEPDNSRSSLQLRELFSFTEIAHLPLEGLPLQDDFDEIVGPSDQLEYWCRELADLIECLFTTLSTTEMALMAMLARQQENSAVDDRELVLNQPESDLGEPKLQSEPANELLKVVLELIASKQESLKDTRYAKYLEHKTPKLDAKKFYQDLREQSLQTRCWTKMLELDSGKGITPETQTAMVLNLARIARAFGKCDTQHARWFATWLRFL